MSEQCGYCIIKQDILLLCYKSLERRHFPKKTQNKFSYKIPNEM